MDELKDRIKKERLKKELNQPQLAKIMSVSKQTVSNWENGNRIPDTLTLSKLADFFGCSVDYLLGKTDIKQNTLIPPNQITSDADEFDDEIRAIARNMKNLSTSKRKLLNDLIKTMSEDADRKLKK